ncbi:MAG: alpha/beta hydrolase, partial [Bacteroidota bacterium]
LSSCLISEATAQSLTGDWYGLLDAMGTELAMVLHISKTEDGTLVGTFDSPDQNAYGIAMDLIEQTGNQLRWSINMMQAEYTGTLSELGLKGEFTQAGFDFPLDFSRTPLTRTGLAVRPQDPQDFPYERIPVTFGGGEEGVLLAGEITRPQVDEMQRPAEVQKIKAGIILVAGSGGQDRNSELGRAINHRPFLVLSDFLTRNGYAVLRYDERGIAESSGDHSSATSADLALDATAAAHFFRSQVGMEEKPIGIMGHSEGGLIGPMVFNQDPEALDFLVLLAGPALPGDSIILEQSRLIQQQMGAPPTLIERNLNPQRRAFSYMRNHPNMDDVALEAELVQIYVQAIDDLPAPLQASIDDKEAFARQQMGPMVNPWLRFFISTDPDDYLSQVTIPVLALNGELDLQVVAQPNLEAIARSVGSNGNGDVTIVPLPGLNHLFQTAARGTPDEYGQIQETFSPTAMRIMLSWLDERFGI